MEILYKIYENLRSIEKILRNFIRNIRSIFVKYKSFLSKLEGIFKDFCRVTWKSSENFRKTYKKKLIKYSKHFDEILLKRLEYLFNFFV